MFEPENEIERMLVLAAKDPAARPAFARALMEADVYLVFVAEGGPLAAGPDGKVTIPEGTRLIQPNATRGEGTFIPFFSARSRALPWFQGDHIVMPDKARHLFARHPDTSFILNPASDYGKEFLPDEIKRHLGGDFEEYPRTEVIRNPQQILLAHPKERPLDLLAALSRELGAVKSVRAAYLMYAVREGTTDPSWMLGVDHGGAQEGSWDDVRAAIGRAVAGNVLNGQILDAVSLDRTSLASTLRTGIPVIAARRSGFLQKLLG
jgi:hypothetical protein